jgi:hypothetical protein
MNINEVVESYVECGRKFGFAVAEMILSKYTDKREGKCYDVPLKKREAFVRDLKVGAASLDLRSAKKRHTTAAKCH